MEDEVKKEKESGGSPKWMTTFADLMSLLMCFFILLLSFSNMDQKKFKKVAGSMENAFGMQKEVRQFGNPAGNMMITTGFDSVPMAVKIHHDVEDIFSEETASGSAEIEYDAAGKEITLRIKDSLVFDFGRADIRKEFKPLLDKVGKLVKDLGVKVTVNGHTDNIPVSGKRSPFHSNWGLSSMRAVTVVEYWITKYKIAPEQLVAAGYADGKPLAPNTTPVNRARNRRVEFVFKPSKPGEVFNGLEPAKD